jgi:adenylate kinase family enzyme
MKRSVYIISGPAGVGKSTTSQELVKQLERSSYISGDEISHITVNGRGKPWLCQETLKLTWTNILSLTRNLIEFRFDVVIDYVTFPSEAIWLAKELESLDVNIFYVVLMVDEASIVKRDLSRDPAIQMGDRSLILLKEFKEAITDDRYIFNTQHYSAVEVNKIINEIMNNKRFLISEFGEEVPSDNTTFTHRAGALGRRRGFKEMVAATTPYGSS